MQAGWPGGMHRYVALLINHSSACGTFSP